MSKSTLCTIFAFFPFLALAGSIGLLERVPNLPTSAEAALSGRTALAATVKALQRDIDAAQDALSAEADAAAEKSIESAEQQQRNVEKFTGMSAAEMEAADDDEVEAAMLQNFGMNMADMEAMENMTDAEIEAYMAGKQTNTQKVSEFAASAPKISDPKKFERLTREFGDWQSGEIDRITKAQEEWKALLDRWAQDRAQLNARLNTELASEESQVPIVDCGEAGDEPDARALYAIKLKRAKAHAQLAPRAPQAGPGISRRPSPDGQDRCGLCRQVRGRRRGRRRDGFTVVHRPGDGTATHRRTVEHDTGNKRRSRSAHGSVVRHREGPPEERVRLARILQQLGLARLQAGEAGISSRGAASGRRLLQGLTAVERESGFRYAA